jgi:hypothetical protein
MVATLKQENPIVTATAASTVKPPVKQQNCSPSGNGDDVAAPALAVAEGAAQDTHLNLKIRFFDVHFRPGSGDQLLLADQLAGLSTKATRMSKARLPSLTGLSPSSSRR